jgi:hypothetical protein
MAPFFALYGYHPEFTWDVEGDATRGEAPAARAQAEAVANSCKLLSDRLAAASKAQAQYYNKKHMPQQYNVGDRVLLSAKNLKLTRPSKKLNRRFMGPFEIIALAGKQAYVLDLPSRFGKIHPVFHVSLLEPYRARGGNDPAPMPPGELIAGEEVWEVEKILDHRGNRHGETEYLVRWTGYPDWEDSYEPEENLTGARGALQDYRRRIPELAPTPRRPQARHDIR